MGARLGMVCIHADLRHDRRGVGHGMEHCGFVFEREIDHAGARQVLYRRSA